MIVITTRSVTSKLWGNERLFGIAQKFRFTLNRWLSSKKIFKNKQGSSSCKVSRKWLTTLPKKIEKTTGSISLAPTIIATVALDD